MELLLCIGTPRRLSSADPEVSLAVPRVFLAALDTDTVTMGEDTAAVPGATAAAPVSFRAPAEPAAPLALVTPLGELRRDEPPLPLDVRNRIPHLIVV